MTEQTTPSKTSETPAHPLLSDWAINRKLEKLEKDYRRDREKKSAEIQSSSSMGNPRVAVIFYNVKRLRQYVEDIEGVYQAEIESGRVADSPDLWVGVYEKLLVSGSAKINSLFSKPEQRMWLSSSGSPGTRASVQAAFEETQRDFSRLRTELDVKLEKAKLAKAVEKAQPTLETTVDAQNVSQHSKLPLTIGRATIGRPRKDAERERILELKNTGKSWAQIARQMNKETGQSKSKDAYRRLCQPSKTK